MKNKSLLLLLCLLVVLVFTACSKESEETKADPTATIKAEPTATSTPAPTSTPALSEEEIWYNSMIEASLMSTGNNARIKAVIEKAAAGEDVYIATIGGSITEGEGANSYNLCYAYQMYQAFAETYGKDGGSNVHFINAGVSGTPSTLGVIRYERDCVTKNDGHLPDLVIVEFAVNDADDPTNGDTYEGLVRHVLNQENDPGVVLLFSVFKSKWNLQDRLKPIGTYYDLPMVSIKDAVVPSLNDGSLTNAVFFNDEYHPKTYGHTLMKDCLMYLFDKIAAEDIDVAAAIPAEGKISTNYENVIMISNKTEDVEITAGGFGSVDNSLGTTRYDKMKTFPDNWAHTSSDSADSFKMSVNCKNLLMTYKSSSAYGEVEVYVDGTLVKTVKGSAGGGWNNPYTVSLIDEDAAGDHEIEIKMAAGSETKNFSILAFGYSK